MGRDLKRTEEKGRDLTQSYEKSQYTIKYITDKVTTQKSHQNPIAQRLWAELGRPVGVTTATQLVWLACLIAQPSHSPQQPCNQKDIHLRICK